MIECALNWARAGWPVFPCNENGAPAVTQWQHAATIDEEVIRRWEESPGWARVACVPGLAGCFVIDVDVKNGKDGEASLAKLEEEHDFEAWSYPQQPTPSGGRHLFLRGSFHTSVQKVLGNGLDTRGGGPDGGLGFVYCYQDSAPGVHSEIPYAPASLLGIAGKKSARDEETQAARVELDQPANIERALRYVKDLPSPGEGERNHQVFLRAATLKDLGLSLAKVFEILEDRPSLTGNPPLCEENPEEFNATVRSAYKNGQLQPGVHAIDEEARDKAAEGFDVAGTEEQEKGNRTTGNRRRFTRWSEERDRDPPPWLIRGVLPKVALAGMYAPGGHYKSFIGLDMLLAVAGGAAEWGGQKISDRGAPVVYVAGEGSAAARVRAWEKTKGASELVGSNFVTYHGLDIMDPDQLDGFRADLEELHRTWGRGPAIIGFDTLARVAPGQDENSAKDMGLFVQKMDMLKEWAGTCVLLVHHTPKASHEWRGSSAVWNALDVGLEVRKKGRNAATVRLARTKDGQEGRLWTVALKEVETGKSIDGEPETSLVVDTIDAGTSRNDDNEGVDKIETQVRMQIAVVGANRAQMARSILDSTAPGFEISRKTLQSQMLAQWPEADKAEIGRWIGSCARKGEIDPAHPLTPYIHSIGVNGPTFSRRAGCPPE